MFYSQKNVADFHMCRILFSKITYHSSLFFYFLW